MGGGNQKIMGVDDVRDVATEAARLSLALASPASPAISAVARLGKKFPLVAPVLQTLGAARKKLDAAKTKKKHELVALVERCTYIAACVIVKCHVDASKSKVAMEVGQLEDCVDAVEQFVDRCGRRGKLSARLKGKRDKNNILELHARVEDLAGHTGLSGIVAVFRGVLVRKVALVLFGILCFTTQGETKAQICVPLSLLEHFMVS